MDLEDISFKLGSVNPSGISDEVYFIPKQEIATWPTNEDDFDEAEDGDEYAQYDGSFGLVAGKTWTRLYSTQGKGKISWEYQGETDCKVVVNKASLSYPKITNEARAFAHHLLCPRALIHSVQATGLRLTEEVLGNLTGCYHHCLSCMRKMPRSSMARLRAIFSPRQ